MAAYESTIAMLSVEIESLNQKLQSKENEIQKLKSSQAAPSD